MAAEPREKIEAEISEVLVDAWAPFGDDAPSDEAAATYAAYAHELYSLLARGALEFSGLLLVPSGDPFGQLARPGQRHPQGSVKLSSRCARRPR